MSPSPTSITTITSENFPPEAPPAPRRRNPTASTAAYRPELFRVLSSILSTALHFFLENLVALFHDVSFNAMFSSLLLLSCTRFSSAATVHRSPPPVCAAHRHNPAVFSQSALLFLKKRYVILYGSISASITDFVPLRSVRSCLISEIIFRSFRVLFQRTFYHKLIICNFRSFYSDKPAEAQTVPAAAPQDFFHPKKDFLCFSSRRAFLFIVKYQPDDIRRRRVSRQNSGSSALFCKNLRNLPLLHILPRFLPGQYVLNHHVAGLVASAAAARRLCDQLKGPLRRTEIRNIQRRHPPR